MTPTPKFEVLEVYKWYCWPVKVKKECALGRQHMTSNEKQVWRATHDNSQPPTSFSVDDFSFRKPANDKVSLAGKVEASWPRSAISPWLLYLRIYDRSHPHYRVVLVESREKSVKQLLECTLLRDTRAVDSLDMALTPFQIMSDLHLETHVSYTYTFKQKVPYLALLGDIGLVRHNELYEFLEKQVKRYWAVFFLLGNHEPADLTFEAAKASMQAFESRMAKLRSQSTIGRFVFLDQTRYDISSTLTILGCTLFSQVPQQQEGAVASRLVDFRSISQWTVHDHNSAHQTDLKWLNQQVMDIAENEPHRKIAIFTHHSPCVDERAVDPKHASSEVSSGFATDRKSEICWTSPTVKAWAFGHTHFNTSFTNEYGAGVIANQKGYNMIPVSSFDPGRVYYLGE